MNIFAYPSAHQPAIQHEQGDRATQAVLTCRSHLVKGTIYYGTHYYSASRPETEGAPFLFGRDDNSSGCGCLGMRVGGAAVIPLVSAGLACVSDNAVGRSTRPVLVFGPDSLSWAKFRPHEDVACDKVKHCPTFRIEIGPRYGGKPEKKAGQDTENSSRGSDGGTESASRWVGVSKNLDCPVGEKCLALALGISGERARARG